MKKMIVLIVVTCLYLAAACGEIGKVSPLHQANAGRRDGREPAYQLDETSSGERFALEDGTLLAYYSCQTLRLSVSHPEEMSDEDRRQAERNAESFNQMMEQLMEQAAEGGEKLGESARAAYDQGFRGTAFTDVTTASGTICGLIVSVRVDNSGYSGGAHGNGYTDGYLFALSVGRFIEPIQIADDPEGFRLGAAELLIKKAEEDEQKKLEYWSDYQSILSRWNEGTVLFDDQGMTVVYSYYELGPYAMGPVEFFLSYDEIRDLLGPGGLDHLGMAEGA